MICVTKTYLPDREKYKKYVDQVFDSGWLTNSGVLVNELEKRLQAYLGVKNLILVANGTLALQVAFKALELRGEVITTPFSFVATSSSLVWERLKPVFVDIDKDTWNIDVGKIEGAITDKTSAILPVHVFGNPCDIELIESIASRNSIRVIYDAAHAFGVEHCGKSIFNYGDISTVSFHATKLFHTIEGGAIIVNNDNLAEKIRLMINFGIKGPSDIRCLGINAKMNEFQAAMGLCVLDDFEKIKTQRKDIWTQYEKKLGQYVRLQSWSPLDSKNYSYFPILLKNEEILKLICAQLSLYDIYPRRYFYPSLDQLRFLNCDQEMIVSKNTANRIICLPIYPSLNFADVEKISRVIVEVCENDAGILL